MKEFDAFPNLKTYISGIQNKKYQVIFNKDILQRPIILKWAKRNGMNKSLLVIDKKVGKLLNLNQRRKLENWLLGDDQQFNSMSAERYIADYLEFKLKQTNIYTFRDNPQTKGIDGFIFNNLESIGVEITTLNGFLAEWMLIERLNWLFEMGNMKLLNNGIVEILYSGNKLIEFRKGVLVQEMQDYIKKAFSCINNHQEEEKFFSEYLSMGFELDKNGSPCCISWKQLDNKDSNLTSTFLDDLTNGVIRKLETKKSQLKNQAANIVFVGVNHTSCSNWLNPGIFRELGDRSNAESYIKTIEWLEKFYSSELPDNILGVVFFVYSLSQEEPFYPLFLLKNGKINHNLYKNLYALLFQTTRGKLKKANEY